MATLKITSAMRRMVLDRDYYEAVGEYVRAVDRLREVETRHLRERRAPVYHHDHNTAALSLRPVEDGHFIMPRSKKAE